MKVMPIKPLVLVTVVTVILSFAIPNQKKRITDANYRYEFYTTLKQAEPREDRFYHWFKAGAIHTSENGVSGELLDGNFEKFYLDNQIAEKGEFSKGLKVNSWKTWHKNGALNSKQYWKDGRKSGSFYSYDTNGLLVEKGQFSKGKKYGKWINYIKKDTLIYKNDIVFIKPLKKTKEQKLADKEKAKAQKKTKKDLQKANGTKKRNAAKKIPSKSSKQKLAVEKTQDTTQKKGGLLKRLFSKKTKHKHDDSSE